MTEPGVIKQQNHINIVYLIFQYNNSSRQKAGTYGKIAMLGDLSTKRILFLF